MSKVWKAGETSGEWGAGRGDRGTRRQGDKEIRNFLPLVPLSPCPPFLPSPFPTPFLPYLSFLPFMLPPRRRIARHRRRSQGAKRLLPHRPPHLKPEVRAIAHPDRTCRRCQTPIPGPVRNRAVLQ